MNNALSKRVRKLEKMSERSSTEGEDEELVDTKHLARVLWHCIYSPRRNDTEARLKRREELIHKFFFQGQGWTEEEAAEFNDECEGIGE